MATRSLVVEIVGDASSLEREFKRATQAAGRFSGSVKEQAAGAITAQVGQQHELQKLAAEYRMVARNAKQGSEVQITAARLAANAERQLAGSFGVVNAQTRRSAGGFTVLHGEVGKASRGALAGSGVFRSLGRSIAFASGGFLAFATAGQFLRTSIDAARENQVAQKQLGAQFRASGKDLGVYQAAIDKTANRLTLLSGFTNTELKAGFTTIFRTTNNVAKSLRDLATAADLARAKHLSFAQASLIIAKTEAGNTTLLRRQGFEIRKNATAEEALAVVRAKVAGQAKAGTTSQERFGAVLHNTEEIIGTALLPTLNKYLTSLAKWLTKMNESGQLQRDVTQTTQALTGAFGGIKAIVVPLADAFKTLGGAVGGTRNEVKLLIETIGLVKLTQLATGLGAVGTAAGEAGAAGEVGLLASRLGKLKAFGAAGAIVISIEIIRKIIDSKEGKKFGLDFSGLDLAKDIKKGVDAVAKSKVLGFSLADPFRSQGEKSGREASNAFADGYGKGFASIVDKLVAKEQAAVANAAQFLTQPVKDAVEQAQKRLTVFTLKPAQTLQIQAADKPDDLGVLKKQLAFDNNRIAALRKRQAQGKVGAKSFTAAITNFLNDRNQTSDHINSLIKTAADAAKAKAKERTDRLSQLFDTSISGALNRVQDLGVGKQVAALQSIAGEIQGRIAATKDVLRKRELEDQLLGVIRQQKAARQAVAQNLLDSLSLNVDKAAATKGLADDLAALGAEQHAIQARIASEGKTVELQRNLFDVEQQIVAVRKQHADDVFAILSLRVDKAAVTKSAADDLAALGAEQKFIQARIRSEGKTLDLQQSLLDINQKIIAARKQQQQNRADARNARQFEALGLTATGEERVPGVTALKKRLGSITDLVTGTFLDTKKTHSVLAGVARVLKGGLGTVSREMKQTIDGIFKDLDDKMKSHQGDVTKFQHTSATNIVKGLGLSREQMRALKFRLADVGPGGSVPSRGPAFALAGGATAATAPKTVAAPVKAPVIAKPTAKSISVTVKPTVKPAAVSRAPVVKPATNILHRISRPRALSAVAAPTARIPHIRNPAPATTTHERQARPATPTATYHIDNLHINRPVGNPRDLEDQLEKRTRSRAHTRRGT